jgi:hypothetical protein
VVVARPVPDVEVRPLRTGAPARRIFATHPDDSFPANCRAHHDHYPGDNHPPPQESAGVVTDRGCHPWPRYPASSDDQAGPRMTQRDTRGKTSPAISSIWRRSSPNGQKQTRWQPARA